MSPPRYDAFETQAQAEQPAWALSLRRLVVAVGVLGVAFAVFVASSGHVAGSAPATRIALTESPIQAGVLSEAQVMVQLPKANETCLANNLGWGRRFKSCFKPLGDSGVSGEASIVVCLGGPGTAIGHGIAVGLEPSVGAANCTAKNGCGVHIHSGHSCANSTAQGGHLWMDADAPDPWADVKYESDANGVAEFDFTVAGVRMLDGMPGGVPGAMLGLTFIVHDTAGSRVACGLVVSD